MAAGGQSKNKAVGTKLLEQSLLRMMSLLSCPPKFAPQVYIGSAIGRFHGSEASRELGIAEHRRRMALIRGTGADRDCSGNRL